MDVRPKTLGEFFHDWDAESESESEEDLSEPDVCTDQTKLDGAVDEANENVSHEPSVSRDEVMKNVFKLLYETIGNHNYKAVDSELCILGYDILDKTKRTLSIRKPNDFDAVYNYSYKKNMGNFRVFNCSCRCSQRLVYYAVIEGFRIFLINDDWHQCKPESLKIEFFKAKKSVLLHGSPEEIAEFERATDCKNVDGYLTIHQRDFTLVPPTAGLCPRSVVVREENRRHSARVYKLSDGSDRQRILYSCSNGCKASLIVCLLPSGITVAWKESDDKHSPECRPVHTDHLSEDLNLKIKDYQELDVFAIIPKGEYSFRSRDRESLSPRLVVRDAADKSLCRKFIPRVNQRSVADAFIYTCGTCGRACSHAYYAEEQNRVLAPVVPVGCKSGSYLVAKGKMKVKHSMKRKSIPADFTSLYSSQFQDLKNRRKTMSDGKETTSQLNECEPSEIVSKPPEAPINEEDNILVIPSEPLLKKPKTECEEAVINLVKKEIVTPMASPKEIKKIDVITLHEYEIITIE